MNMFWLGVNRLGSWLKGLTALANKQLTLQIFAPSKFGINGSTGLKCIVQKVDVDRRELFGYTFYASGPIEPKLWVWKNLQGW